MKRSTILRTAGVILLAAAAVTAIGALVVRDQMERHQRDLFSPRPLKRLAALGYIAGLAATVELARTLRDFIAWEDRSMLRRRAGIILERMEGDLDRNAVRNAAPDTSAGSKRARDIAPRITRVPGIAG